MCAVYHNTTALATTIIRNRIPFFKYKAGY